MFTTIAGFFALAGVYNFFADNPQMVILCGVVALIDVCVHFFTGNSPTTAVLAATFGMGYAYFADAPIWYGALVGLCFEGAIMSVFSLLALLIPLILFLKNNPKIIVYSIIAVACIAGGIMLQMPSSPKDTPPASTAANYTQAPTQYYAPAPTPTPQVVVYWTPNGKRYHISKNCRTLSRSNIIIKGTIKEAQDPPRTACAVCS